MFAPFFKDGFCDNCKQFDVKFKSGLCPKCSGKEDILESRIVQFENKLHAKSCLGDLPISGLTTGKLSIMSRLKQHFLENSQKAFSTEQLLEKFQDCSESTLRNYLLNLSDAHFLVTQKIQNRIFYGVKKESFQQVPRSSLKSKIMTLLEDKPRTYKELQIAIGRGRPVILRNLRLFENEIEVWTYNHIRVFSTKGDEKRVNELYPKFKKTTLELNRKRKKNPL